MTFPITNSLDLVHVLNGDAFTLPIVPISVQDHHGNPLELIGVAPQLNDQEEIVGFTLFVRPKEDIEI